jgi:nucleobase:cation symporter-1, NCS1 family
MITCTIFGMLIWALRAAHGAGSLIHTGPSKQGSVLSWNILYGFQSILGAFASGCLGQSGRLFMSLLIGASSIFSYYG